MSGITEKHVLRLNSIKQTEHIEVFKAASRNSEVNFAGISLSVEGNSCKVPSDYSKYNCPLVLAYS